MAQAEAAEAVRECRLYVVSPPQLTLVQFMPQLEAVLKASATNANAEPLVGAFLLQLDDASEAEWKSAINQIQPLCNAHQVAFMLHEHIELAIEKNVDGVHVESTSIADARARLAEDQVVGKTCMASRDVAMKSGDQGADYVAFAPFFAQATPSETAIAAPEIVQWWQELFVLPCAAAGGITPQNCGDIVKAGADLLMVRGAVWQNPHGADVAIATFDAAITEALQNA
ncbi:MAG: thiamine phosphate synthase [Alphaproteobacteria bacterium]|nr:thiamine phosphate synthase [Alphaproteobacteria bacterium]